RIAVDVRRLVRFLQIIAQAHDGQRLLIADMAERGAHQRQGEVPLALLELLQGNAPPRDGEEVEVAALGVLKEILRLHPRLERVQEALRGDRQLLGDLWCIAGVGWWLLPAGMGGQCEQPGGSEQQQKTSKAAGPHGDPFQWGAGTPPSAPDLSSAGCRT